MDAIPQQAKVAADVSAGLLTIGTLLDYAPEIAAVLGGLWYIVVLGEKFYSWYKKLRKK